MRSLIVAFVMLPTVAFAQQQQQEFTLKVTLDEINIISDALIELPAKRVVPLIDKLRKQVAAQQRPVEVRPSEPPK